MNPDAVKHLQAAIRPEGHLRDVALAQIAKDELGVFGFSFDYVSVTPEMLKKALQRAYEAGQKNPTSA